MVEGESRRDFRAAVHGAFRELAEHAQAQLLSGKADALDRVDLYSEPPSGDWAVDHQAAKALGLDRRNPTLRVAVRGITRELEALGLLVQGSPTQETGRFLTSFRFTERGLAYFTGQGPRLETDGSIGAALRELSQRKPNAIVAGQVVLLDEAQRCWTLGCYRAAMVLIGVASEESIGRLLEALTAWHERDPATSSLWSRVDDSSAGMSSRLRAGVELLQSLTKSMKRLARVETQASGNKPVWADLWHFSVSALDSFAEAVRQARNLAAHDASHEFRRSDVGLLLASAPMQLEHIAELAEFLCQVGQGKLLRPADVPAV